MSTHHHNHGHHHGHDDHHDHEDHHEHSHSHHHHHHGPKSYNKAFAIGISLNVIFVVVEFAFGFFSRSLALMADAGHNLSDVAGLLLAWGAVWLTAKNPSEKYTYGFRKSTILSALFNAVLLLVAVGIIIWEAFNRLRHPTPIIPSTVMIVAGIGIVINGITAFLFFRDKDHDINMKGAYLHMAADALISVGVVVSALIVSYTSWDWIDPVVSIVISLIIIFGTWDLLRSSVHLALDAVPYGINLKEVKNYLESLEEVSDVHDLHIWPLSTTESAMTAHLTIKCQGLSNDRLVEIAKALKEKYRIDHPTIQTEIMDNHFECAFKPDHVL